MTITNRILLNRRDMLRTTAGIAAGAAWTRLAAAADMPAVTRPRATSGDTAVEPDWKERLTLTVGPEKADLVGTTDKVLQAAVDYVARMGGGTVHVMPGEYRMRNAVYIPSGIRIRGSGLDSVIVKEPSVRDHNRGGFGLVRPGNHVGRCVRVPGRRRGVSPVQEPEQRRPAGGETDADRAERQSVQIGQGVTRELLDGNDPVRSRRFTPC